MYIVRGGGIHARVTGGESSVVYLVVRRCGVAGTKDTATVV